MPTAASPLQPPSSYEELAKLLELSLLSPELTEEDISQGCATAKRLKLATVVARPSDLDLAERWTGAAVTLGAAIDWPHGYSTTAVKQYAARDALRRGAKEIIVAMNTSKLVSRQFQYLEMELNQISEACHEVGALLTVNLESQFLNEEHKVVACRVAKRVAADYLATGNPSDIALLRQYTRDRIKVKLRGVESLNGALDAIAAGCYRIETTDAVTILEAWKARLSEQAAQQNA